MQTITVKCKLTLSDDQREAIDKTLVAFANATNDAIGVGRQMGSTSNVRIHGKCYHAIRTAHGLSANLAVRAIARAAGILKVKARKHSTVKATSIDYDARIFSFREATWTVSLSTVEGRLKGLTLKVGHYQKDLLQGRKPTSAVLWKTRQEEYYIGIHIDVETPPPHLDEDHAWLGVDLGIVEIATTSQGDAYTGEVVDRVRERHFKTRRSLQSKGTRGTRQLLRRLSGKERRFQSWHNHTVSKRIVERAKAGGMGIRLEDLSGIRDGIKVRRSQRRRHHAWAFYQLKRFIVYKAAIAGVPIELVDPRYTSRTCSQCGHCEKANRKSQSAFVCKHCQYCANADVNAAMNIAAGGVHKPSRESTQVVACAAA